MRYLILLLLSSLVGCAHRYSEECSLSGRTGGTGNEFMEPRRGAPKKFGSHWSKWLPVSQGLTVSSMELPSYRQWFWISGTIFRHTITFFTLEEQRHMEDTIYVRTWKWEAGVAGYEGTEIFNIVNRVVSERGWEVITQTNKQTNKHHGTAWQFLVSRHPCSYRAPKFVTSMKKRYNKPVKSNSHLSSLFL
jgi:hypothetical protein